MKIQALSIVVLVSLTTGCAKFPNSDSLNSLSVDSISDVNNIGSISDMKPKIGNVDIAEAASAAKDLGNAVMISDEEITKMALGYANHSDKSNKLAQSGSSYVTRLMKLVGKHQNEDGLRLNYKVYISKDVNAFSLADGSVRVHSGLMDMMNDNELLAVIGHEIGHVKLGHSADRIRLANIASGVRKGVGSTSTIAGVVANDDMVGGFMEKVVNSQFSQSQETDADEYSVEFMKRNGYSLDAEITAFNKLAELEGKSGFVDGILSSHPASEERAKHLAEIIGDSSKVKIVAKNDANSQAQASNNQQASLKVEQTKNAKTFYGKQAQVVPSAAASSKLNQRWYVQVSAHTDKNEAVLAASKFENAGYKTSHQSALVNGVQYNRVLVGPYGQKSEAAHAKQKMLSSSITNQEPFLRVVK